MIVMVESLNLNLTAHESKQTAQRVHKCGQLHLSPGKAQPSCQQAASMLRQQWLNAFNLFGFISPCELLWQDKDHLNHVLKDEEENQSASFRLCASYFLILMDFDLSTFSFMAAIMPHAVSALNHLQSLH